MAESKQAGRFAGNKRIDFLRPYIENRKVLDLGCVQHSLSNVKRPDWLHRQIADCAASTLGVDILQESVDYLNQHGFRAVCADVERMQLGERFDVIFAGELIEHLAGPGAFLERAREHLEPGGRLILTTPNAFALGNSILPLRLLLGAAPSLNPEHTCWYCAGTLRQLLERYGYEIESMRTIPRDRYPGWKRAWQARFLRPVAPALFAVAR